MKYITRKRIVLDLFYGRCEGARASIKKVEDRYQHWKDLTLMP